MIPSFQYSLNPTGFLLLGASESIGGFTDLFSTVDPTQRLYAKKVAALRHYPHFDAPERRSAIRGPDLLTPAVSPENWQREADRVLLNLYAPAGVLVTRDLDVLHYRGRTGPYLEPAPGEPGHSLLRIAREGLFPVLRDSVDECARRNAAVLRSGVRVRSNGHSLEIDLRIVPINLPGVGEGCFLVLFEDGRTVASRPESTVSVAPDDRTVVELRQELASVREYMQRVSGQADAANEELKSANEEILSSNEELQSTNEELTTAKEELHSVNEELTTTNEQLQHRNLGLNRLNDDLVNLLNSADVPLVILGRDLRIRRFTPQAGTVLNLLPGDVGRPIGDIKPMFEVPDLELLLLEVIESVQLREREVQDRGGRWYALRVHSYRTADAKIDGAVMVLLDIHHAKVAHDELGRRVEQRTAELASANEALRTEVTAHGQVEAAHRVCDPVR